MVDTDIDIELYYRFVRLDTKQGVTVKRDAAPPDIVSAGGRWDVINRPRRVSFTTWNGSDPYRIDVPVLFDGWDTGRSMENAISILNQMSVNLFQDYAPPPQVQVTGALPVKGAKWVLDPIITWGQNVIWHEDGYRLRQDAVVHLLQFVEPDQLQIKPSQGSILYHVKKGDTLKSISKDHYGTPKFWTILQSANSIRDIKKLPKTLRIPPIIGS